MVSPIPASGKLSGDFSFLEAITMNAVKLVGIDLGKHCFHLHGQDASGRMVFRKKLSRSQMEGWPGIVRNPRKSDVTL